MPNVMIQIRGELDKIIERNAQEYKKTKADYIVDHLEEFFLKDIKDENGPETP